MKIKNKLAIAALAIAGLGAGSFAIASAVDLGLSANNQLGAGVSVTETCQPVGATNQIKVGFGAPTFVPATKTFTVSSVNLSAIAAPCNGQNVQIVVSDKAGASLGTYSGVIAGTSVTAALGTPVNASAVANVSVVIYSTTN